MDAIRHAIVACVAVFLLAARPAIAQDDWAMRFAQAERLRQERATSDLPASRSSRSTARVAQAPATRPPGAAPTPPPAAPAQPPAAPGGTTVPGPAATPPTAVPPPPATAAAPPTALAAATAADRSLMGGFGLRAAPVMLGDQPPVSALRAFPRVPAAAAPPIPPIPPVPPTPPGRVVTTALAPSARGFKISENQSPRPQDRVFASFSYYADINGAVNRALGGFITNMTVYRELFGVEKTFLDGDASLGLRMPVDTLVVRSPFQGIGGTSTAVGNVTVFGKYILWADDETNSLISGGMSITSPTGPARFADSPAAFPLRDVQLQPFLGYIFNLGDFFIQGFTAIDVPTDDRDVTLYYNDFGLGYYLFRSDEPTSFVNAVVPTFEVHVNTPLNHRGALNPNDPFGSADIVNLTYGANVLMGGRALLSVGVVTPVTGPRPFDYEFLALLNIYFGRTGRNPALQTVPLFAGP
jgi:hypothetical protein